MRQEKRRFFASRNLIAAAALGIGLATTAGTASAALIIATLDGAGGGIVEYITEDSATGAVQSASVSAAMFFFTRTGGDYPNTLLPGLSGAFYAIPIEPPPIIRSESSYTFEVVALESVPGHVSGMGATRASLIGHLLYGVQQATSSLFQGSLNAQALQVAVWELIYELDVDLDNPNFNVNEGLTRFANASHPDALALANNWLDDFVNQGYDPMQPSNLIALSSPDIHDFIAFFSDDPYPIPEPGTLTLFALGLFGIAMTPWRRRHVITAS